jgi:hypothetical protein
MGLLNHIIASGVSFFFNISIIKNIAYKTRIKIKILKNAVSGFVAEGPCDAKNKKMTARTKFQRRALKSISGGAGSGISSYPSPIYYSY